MRVAITVPSSVMSITEPLGENLFHAPDKVRSQARLVLSDENGRGSMGHEDTGDAGPQSGTFTVSLTFPVRSMMSPSSFVTMFKTVRNTPIDFDQARRGTI